MKEFWNSRYKEETYAYGTQPNEFFRRSIDNLSGKGKILLPAEGEGRNAVYAAKKGLEVFAFDISEEGKSKAEKLAKAENVNIHYEVGEFDDLSLANERFDMVGLIYAHFPPEILTTYHKKIVDLMNPNGYLILEGFSKGHIEMQQKYPNVGGPRSLELLFSMSQIQKEFASLEVISLEETEVELNEGLYHVGIGKVIRFIGRKPE